MNSQQQAFREAMAHLSAAVSVITSYGPAGRCGITATAVCSVTDTPPTLLVCVNRNSALNEVIKANGRLCVNVLASEHEEVARHFAGITQVTMEQRFGLHDWQLQDARQPKLAGALANLEGRVTQVQEVGTHSVLLVELEDIQVRDSGDGLVYFSRAFHPLTRPSAAI
ncbi:4-hydroxyphenylacetate 3-monooxygenase, reductase component [Pseudomonas sp. 148P]|uniref:4-hydroxyphenylacetate 3-monooxygenase reductase component n=1 Tax=Pseudomonas ulcerans TaxID=3115852 RepID=A0ABU7HTE1_9PSED|nr:MULTISPECIES: 4-hydroxyphenylacetate 3-monooxygenase, reductase component [unclassified Pseudomonas]MEE1923330.1 4-hydroxyphenylacetate 3-monooxygenase, reductase component [Pseudomonas sp. 147P]MEE1934794.1 4-hydroxyphenylacetate 3-monooxygenase, reductase component [Pseudomonas sp. 148P]